jgi:hypothetical protein
MSVPPTDRSSFNIPTVDKFIFKGTHNSYQCNSGTNPIMNHPPDVQIDAFGVWAVELDVGLTDDGLTSVVGHEAPGDGICPGWGLRLTDFLQAIHATRSRQYRPVFIYFEIKDSYDDSFAFFRTLWKNFYPDDPLGRCDDHYVKYQFAKNAVAQVFGDDFIELYDFVDRNRRYPTLDEMVGKAVIYYPSPEYDPGSPGRVCNSIADAPFKGTLKGTAFDACTDKAEVLAEIVANGWRIPRVDQYQADWTFDYGAPPDPLVVDSSAQPPYQAPAAVGDSWSCIVASFDPNGRTLNYGNGDVSHGEVVAEQGTWCFPYQSIARAVARAEGTTPPVKVGDPIRLRESARAGFGWTVLIKPGTYRENFTIDFPLTLKKDGGDGAVLIVGQGGRTVRSLWITFSTGSEDKDADTGLRVQVTSAAGRVLGKYEQRRDKRYSVFHNHTEHLQLEGPVLEAEMISATLTIDISPNGNDTWNFAWQLDGTWSDGGPFSDHATGIALSDERAHLERTLSF